jgi:NAD(P)-dependent dehydrogenase (short-subunit alcohol dehydrogenase family)
MAKEEGNWLPFLKARSRTDALARRDPVVFNSSARSGEQFGCYLGSGSRRISRRGFLGKRVFPMTDLPPRLMMSSLLVPQKVLMLNLQRVFTLTQKLMPLLSASGTRGDPARIINIGSIDGLTVPPQETYAYSASKVSRNHRLGRIKCSL